MIHAHAFFLGHYVRYLRSALSPPLSNWIVIYLFNEFVHKVHMKKEKYKERKKTKSPRCLHNCHTSPASDCKCLQHTGTLLLLLWPWLWPLSDNHFADKPVRWRDFSPTRHFSDKIIRALVTILKMHLRTKNELSMSRLWIVAVLRTDRQIDRQTDRQTRPKTLPGRFAGGKMHKIHVYVGNYECFIESNTRCYEYNRNCLACEWIQQDKLDLSFTDRLAPAFTQPFLRSVSYHPQALTSLVTSE